MRPVSSMTLTTCVANGVYRQWMRGVSTGALHFRAAHITRQSELDLGGWRAGGVRLSQSRGAGGVRNGIKPGLVRTLSR